MNKGLRIGTLVLALALGACGSSSEEEKLKQPVDLPEFDAKVSVSTEWKKDLGSDGNRPFGFIEPVIHGQHIYVASGGGKVFKLDKKTGDQKWKTDLNATLVSGVAYRDGSIYVGLKNGVLVCLNENDGIKRWEISLGGEIMAPVAVDKGHVFAQTANGLLLGLDQENGEEVWRSQSTLPLLTVRGTATPIVIDGTVITGLANGKLVAIDIKTGIQRWDSRLAIPSGSSDIEKVVDVDVKPLLLGNRILAGSYNGSIAMVDAATGQAFWQKETSVRGDLSEGFGNVYFASSEGEIIAYDASSAQIQWVNESLLRRGLGDTATWINYVIAADYKGYLHILSQRDGSLVGRSKIGGQLPRSPFVISDNTLYVLNDEGKLFALTLENKE